MRMVALCVLALILAGCQAPQPPATVGPGVQPTQQAKSGGAIVETVAVEVEPTPKPTPTPLLTPAMCAAYGLTCSQAANIQLAIALIRDYGDTAAADYLEARLRDGRMRVDSTAPHPETKLWNTIVLPNRVVGLAHTWTAKTDFGAVVRLASSLVHEYRHTQQSELGRYLWNLKDFLGLDHLGHNNWVEFDAWGSQILYLERWMNREFEAYARISGPVFGKMKQGDPPTFAELVAIQIHLTRLKFINAELWEKLDTFVNEKDLFRFDSALFVKKLETAAWWKAKIPTLISDWSALETELKETFKALEGELEMLARDLAEAVDETVGVLEHVVNPLQDQGKEILRTVLGPVLVPLPDLVVAALPDVFRKDMRLELWLVPSMKDLRTGAIVVCLEYRGGELVKINESRCETADTILIAPEGALVELVTAGDPPNKLFEMQMAGKLYWERPPRPAQAFAGLLEDLWGPRWEALKGKPIRSHIEAMMLLLERARMDEGRRSELLAPVGDLPGTMPDDGLPLETLVTLFDGLLWEADSQGMIDSEAYLNATDLVWSWSDSAPGKNELRRMLLLIQHLWDQP